MSTTERSAFLTRVAAAVRSGNRYRDAASPAIAPSVGYLGAGPDPIARLVNELRAVGVQPHRVRSCEETQSVIRALVDRFAIRRAIRSAAALLEELRLDAALAGVGVELLTPPELAGMDEATRRDRMFAADLGVAAPDWAIAETGTLVYASGPEQTRSATLLPPVHLAIVDAARVLADLFDLPARLAESATGGVMPRNVALITGPSKTGDIELRLTTGVHGPGEVIVLIWSDGSK